MPIITIASSKGGPGKTTLAELIAGRLAAEGAKVVALDADPTGGLSRWATRLYEGPAFVCHHEADEARLAHLIHRVSLESDVVLVDTAGFGNRAATVAMTAADVVLIPMVPGEGDVTEAARTMELVAGVASAARREIASRVVLNRVRPATALSRHAAAEASPHYSREMRGQSQAVDIVHNYANGLFDEVFCNEISGPGVWWPGPISGGPMNYSG